ncbi:MAG: V-type ATP synthase subunit D [Clostridium sp.]|jgi:V/A-type H+-transporting ATPase subunit D|nr:V-type ATP synthase subunit D [Clostridium sp.]
MAKKQVFPTKGNLMAIKKSNALAKVGYDLMDRKRNILIREIMSHLDEVNMLRDQIETTFSKAYMALQEANTTLGIITDLTEAVPIDNGISITYKSVMGVDIPVVHYEKAPIRLTYGMERANTKFDYAYKQFYKVKELTVVLAEIENSVYRLANAIRKSQKRANALKNIVIPEFEGNIKYITEALEEKEREEFTRQKVIKDKKEKQNLR